MAWLTVLSSLKRGTQGVWDRMRDFELGIDKLVIESATASVGFYRGGYLTGTAAWTGAMAV